MELVTGTEVLEAPSREGYTVKAFNINKQEIPQGVVAGCVKEILCLKGLQEVKRRIGIHLVLHGASSAPQHFLELVNKYTGVNCRRPQMFLLSMSRRLSPWGPI